MYVYLINVFSKTIVSVRTSSLFEFIVKLLREDRNRLALLTWSSACSSPVPS